MSFFLLTRVRSLWTSPAPSGSSEVIVHQTFADAPHHAWLLERLTLSYHATLRLVSSKKKQVVVQDVEQVIFE
jgi:hypothetical protein